jgi:hypothetical protein
MPMAKMNKEFFLILGTGNSGVSPHAITAMDL